MMISKTIKQTKARINAIMSKVLVFMIILIPCFYASLSPLYGQDTDLIDTGELIVQGVTLEINPAQQTVPINTETIVNTVFIVDNPELVEGMIVTGILRGPGIKNSISLTTLPNHPFAIPGFTLKGTYTLENIQLEKNGKKLVTAQPEQAVIEAMDIIVTKVESRPLTLEEIREKGIVISEENFSVYNFSIGFIVNSQEVKYEFPIVYSGNNEVYIPSSGTAGIGGAPGGFGKRAPIPVDIELPELKPTAGDNNVLPSRPISGVVIFNNDIAFLNQFFSVMFIVTNQAPEGSLLALKDVNARITFPDGLREAQTNPPHLMGAPVPVHCPGPDGKIGTADDLDVILATFSGMAEFLAEGLKEGTHIVDINFEGTLAGLPSGDTPFTGKAAGAVIVRNPEFGITFTHPAVIRKGEEYDVYVNMTNTSPVTANLVSLTLPATRLVGTSLLSDETVSWETIVPGESVTAKFHMRSLETGRIRASAFEADGNVSGRFVLTVGVGEQGIPLSPDTLVLPEWAYSLPNELINAALMMLGEAYCIATTPPGGLPEGLPYISSELVKERAVEFADAGQRFTYGDSLINTVEILTLDWLGSRLPDINFDILRRLTSKGLAFAQQQAIIFNDALNSQGAVQFQRTFTENCSYKPPFISALLSFGGGTRSANLRITDFYKNRLSNEQGILNLIRNIPYGELYLMEAPGQGPVDFALIGHPDENGYTIEILGETEGTVDLSLIVPDATGGFRQVVFPGIASQPGSIAGITITSADTNFILSIDNNGDGQGDSQVSGNVTPVQAPPLQLLGAIQECSADSGGHATALFFNRPLDPTSAKDKTHYSITDKSIYASFLQPSGRVVLIGTDNPISPFVDTLVRVENLKDTSGGWLTPSPTEMKIIPTINTPGGIVFGRVLSALGEPIANAKIQLTEKNGAKLTHCFDISDATGSYQFDFVRIFADPFTIEVLDVNTNKIEKVSSRLMSHGQRLQIDIIMRGRGSVQGKVLNTNGTGLASAAVSAQSQNSGVWETFATSTDENGEYMINDIPIGNVNLNAAKSGQYGSASTAITAPGQIQTVDITVVGVKTAKVSGRVFFNDGVTPAADAYVNFYGPYQYASGTQTDAQGYFQFTTVPIGTFSIKVYNPLTGKQGGYVTGQLVENQDYNATIIFRGFGRIYGKVLSYDGVPQPGVFVLLEGTSSYMDTDTNGNFDFHEVPVGNYTVNATHRTLYLKAFASVKLITEGQEAYATLVFPSTLKGNITGTVFDVDGVTKMPNIDVYVCDGNYMARGIASTNQYGVFTIGNLDPGNYILFIVGPDLGGVARTTIKFSGHQAECNVQFLGKGNVNINVFASDGQTRVMADVTFNRLVFEVSEGDFIGFRQIEEKYTSNQDGPLLIEGVYMGAFSVSAKNGFYPRGAYYSGKITSPGQEVNVDLVMKPTGKVTGYVVSWDGVTKVPGVSLEFKSGVLKYTALSSEKEGEKGYFEFTLVPPGNFQIYADDSLSGLKGACYGTMGETGDLAEVTLRLLGKGQVNGVVKSQSVGLIPNAKVTLKTNGFPNETYYANTGDQGDSYGKFFIHDVWEGKFSVSAFFSDLQIGGRAEGEIPAHNTQANVEVVLEAIGTVKGRVMSPDGVSEMTDTQVVLYHSKFNYKAVGYFYVSQEGGYTFENIPKGQFYLEALHPASGRKGKSSGSITTEGQVAEVDVYLEGRGTVTGTFYDGSGANPVPYAGIKINSQGTYPFTLQSTTDAQGNFTFGQIAQGKFDLDAADPSNGLTGSASGQVQYDGETVYIDVIAQGWGRVKGIVSNAQETVVNGATVKLTQGSKVWTEFSGPDLNNPNDPKLDGEYEFTLVPVGSFSIVAYDPVTNGSDYGTGSGKVEFHGQVVTVDIKFKGLGTVTGHVFDGSMNPMGGIPVTLTSGNGNIPSVSNSEGMFKFTDVRMGPFSLEATQAITKLSASGSGELTQDGQTVTVDLILESAGSVIGRVLNPDGTTPTENAYLKLKGTNFTKYYYTGANGEFVFDAVRLGDFTLEVQGMNQEGKARVSKKVEYDGHNVNLGDLVLDNELPQVTGIKFLDNSDVNGSVGIPLTTSMKISFSEPTAAASISNSTIYLNSINGKVYGSLALQADGKSVVFTPPTLSSFVLYTLNVTYSIEDIAGNTLGTTATASFTTSDILPPLVAAINPANAAQGVQVNAVITATFNEPVDDSKFNHQDFVVKKGELTGGEPINHQSLVFNASKTSVTFTPGSPLQANAKYSVWLSNFCDFSNNLQTTPFTSHFYAVDTLAPTFKSISPPSGTTVTEGAPVTVTVTFNESDIAVVHFSVNGQTKYSDTGSPYIYQFTTPLISQGGNSLLVEILAVDNAGNQSTKANLTINLKQDVPPLITLTGPPVSTVLPGGTINCSITASDDLGLTRVVLTALGGNLNYSSTQNISGTSFTKYYTIAVPADIQPNTDIILHAYAVDVRTNATNAKDIQIHVPQDELNPTVNITSPTEGSRFKHKEEIKITAIVSDDVGIKEVRIYLDDQLLATHTQAPYTATYTVPPLEQEKQSVVKVEAEDLSGKVSQDTVNIVQEKLVDLTAPQVKIITPSDGTLVFAGENLKIKVDATDDEGVDQLEIYVNDELQQTFTQSPYEMSYTIPSGAEPGSSITIKAVATDVDNKTGTDQVSVEVATGTFLPNGTVIEATNTTYDNKTIIINSGTVTINGAHTFVNVLVKESGTLTHSSATSTKTYSMQLTVTGKLVIGPDAKISAIGRGYLGAYQGDNTGTNYGRTLENTIIGGSYKFSGGSYGGSGGKYTDASKILYESNKIYGSIENPSDPGSGGGAVSSNSPATCGGGVIIINSTSVINDGTITSNANNTTAAGAGSGGSINIHTGILNGSGTITANGGSNTSTSSTYGAGGGGRIAVYYENASGFNLANINAYGGKFSGYNYVLNASAGTVYLKQTYQEPQLIINNNSTSPKYRDIFPEIGPGVIKNLSSTVLTTSNASYMKDSLIGMELIPDIDNKDQTFTIIANDKDTITIDSADGNLLTATSEGKTYGGMAVFDGHMIIRNGTHSEIKGDVRLGNLSVLQNSILVQSTTTVSNVYSLSLKVTGKVFADDTSKISANGCGYLGGMRDGSNNPSGYTLDNTTFGGSYLHSGASYGGSGGQYDTDAVNTVYGSIYEPVHPGSGGGGVSINALGGSGGGVIAIEAQELQINGSICSNGSDAVSAGAGSGGSILLKTAILNGNGTITANGGNSTYYAAGGGGRIAVYYEDASAFDLTKITAYGGIYTNGSNSTRNGGAGTIYLEKKGEVGEIIIDNNSSDSSNGTPLPGTLVTTGNIILDGSQAKFEGNLKVEEMTLIDATLSINGILEVDRLNMQNGSRVTHSSATSSTTYSLEIKANEITIDESSNIDVTGCGYLGGWQGDNKNNIGRTLENTREGGSDTYSGGGYGGYGGKYTDTSNKTYNSNNIYGSIDNPSDPGSGGGGINENVRGGCGGGVITIHAAEIVNNGSILSNGQDKAYGAGSGGSIKINTGILNGSGMISANGGSSSNYAAGGGGRIALFYEDASGFNLANIKAYGGKYTPGGNSSLNASAGTVYLKQTNQEAQLIINNNNTITTYREIFPVIGPGVITDLSETVLTDADAYYMTDSLIGMELIPDINNKEQTFTIIDNYKNTIKIDPADGNLFTATAKGKTYGGIAVFDGHLKITNTTVSTINGEARLGNLSVLEGSRLKPPAVTATSEYYLSLNVPGKIIVDATSYIEAIGLGYLGGKVSGSTYIPGYTLGNTTTGGSTRNSGGSYGGLGGQDSTYAVNSVYGSLYNPRNPGSGGGGNGGIALGGRGGGVIILEAGEIQLAGTISVNGGTDNSGGSGSGGSILIKTATLTGSGIITANGGANSSSISSCGGGGGRIAVYYNDASQFDLSKITAYGGKYATGSTATKNGGAGTVFLKQSTATYGDLIVNNDNLSSRTDSTPLPAVGQGFNTLLEANRMVTTASYKTGSLIGIKLNPQPTGNTLFTIIDNNSTEIFTDPADGDMTQIGSQNGPYIGEHLVFNLTVEGSAHLFTTDRIQVSGTLIKGLDSSLKAENHQ